MNYGCWGSRRVTVAALVEAVARVAVVGEDDDAVAAPLQADGGVDDEALRAADAEVWVEEDDGAVVAAAGRRGLGLLRHRAVAMEEVWC